MKQYSEAIYAGVLGKMLGVYLGRPVEGWFYERINEAFGEVWHYKNREAGTPLVIPDDDLSGTFGFCRAAEDNGYPQDLTAAQVGEAWLDYLVENKTVLWWGGLSRSTEHTAYLRLKKGIPAPESGSIQRNGRGMAEGIGAQIFIDSWALMNPGEPDRAARFARQAARVSHDGAAVEAAVFLAAMEAMAFAEKNLDSLMDEGLRYVRDEGFKQMVGGLRGACAGASHWRQARDWIAKHHDYSRYPGNCPVQTNHLMLLAALLMGGDDFHKSIMIAASAGWDTDCNAGNVGCLNGIRLGLAGIEKGADLRGPIADRLYLVTADGGGCVTDAVQVARSLERAAAALAGQKADIPAQRYAFEQPGATQGFRLHPGAGMAQAATWLENDPSDTGVPGMAIHYRKLAKGSQAVVCVDTFVDNTPKAQAGTSGFEVYASPTLYPTQTLVLHLDCPPGQPTPALRLGVEYFDGADALQAHRSEPFALQTGENRIQWQVPADCGQAIYRLCLVLESETPIDGHLLLRSLDWAGAPEAYVMGKSYEMTPALVTWTNETTWLKTFVSSAEHFYPEYLHTFSVSHPGPGGVATTGTADWRDYRVESTITLAQQEMAGLVGRAKGHRQFYAAVFAGGELRLLRCSHGRLATLAAVKFAHEVDSTYHLALSMKGDRLQAAVDGEVLAEARDTTYRAGGAGFLVDTGAFVADGFGVYAL